MEQIQCVMRHTISVLQLAINATLQNVPSVKRQQRVALNVHLLMALLIMTLQRARPFVLPLVQIVPTITNYCSVKPAIQPVRPVLVAALTNA